MPILSDDQHVAVVDEREHADGDADREDRVHALGAIGQPPRVLAQREAAARVARARRERRPRSVHGPYDMLGAMRRERHVDPLMKKLVQAIQASLAATDAARDALQEILRRGADTGLFFSGSRSRGFSPELTSQDKEFLRAASIKPDR